MRSLFGGKPTAAALKTGDNLLDFPDYFRPLPVRLWRDTASCSLLTYYRSSSSGDSRRR